MLQNLRIVLVDTSHPGNIGAAARAMKNMSLRRLCLVSPHLFPHEEATSRASGADDLLAAAELYGSLDEAIGACSLVIGTSARPRSVAWPMLTPREAAARLVEEAYHDQVALVFGREKSGLSNNELDRCNYLVQIPTCAEYSSLNLGAAVQVLSYEIYLASLEVSAPEVRRELATAEMLQGFHEHLARALDEVGFTDPNQSEKLLRRLRSLFQRARPDKDEINILRGILTAMQGRSVSKD